MHLRSSDTDEEMQSVSKYSACAEACRSFDVPAPGSSAGAGEVAKLFPVAPPALPQHKVVVGRGAHGVEDVGIVRNVKL